MVVENGDALSLSKGYKQTEVGIVPEGWDVLTLKNVLNGIADVDHYMPKTIDQGIPYLMTGDLKELVSDINFDNCKQISLSDYKLLSKKIKNSKGDLILARYATIGTVSYVDINSDFVVSYSCVTIRPNPNKLAGKFLFHYFKSSAFAIEVSNIINTGTQANVGIGDLYAVKIALPPLSEQTAIANALSDMDALIAQTEKLIEKKKAIKQGVMQELLKPKEGWGTKKLGEVANFRRGSFPQPYGLDKWYDDITGKPFVQVFDVDDDKKLKSETKRYISEEAQKMSVFAKKGTIVLTIQGSIGRIAITQYDAFIDRTLLIFESYKYEFNEYFFMHTIHQLFEIEKQSAPGGIIKTITKDALKNFSISFPEFTEQTRIGFIIKDLESDIVTIETKLQKLKHQKQGMMQALLTGRIRLI